MKPHSPSFCAEHYRDVRGGDPCRTRPIGTDDAVHFDGLELGVRMGGVLPVGRIVVPEALPVLVEPQDPFLIFVQAVEDGVGSGVLFGERQWMRLCPQTEWHRPAQW